MADYTKTGTIQYEDCVYKLPCGICVRTNSMCPMGYYVNTPIVTWTSAVAKDIIAGRKGESDDKC